MSVHIIRNPVFTPEQMAEILGLGSDHIASVRKIMSRRFAFERLCTLR
jgi:hypothetical protein